MPRARRTGRASTSTIKRRKIRIWGGFSASSTRDRAGFEIPLANEEQNQDIGRLWCLVHEGQGGLRPPPPSRGAESQWIGAQLAQLAEPGYREAGVPRTGRALTSTTITNMNTSTTITKSRTISDKEDQEHDENKHEHNYHEQ